MAVFRRVDEAIFWLLLLAGLFIGSMETTGDNILLSTAMAACVCLGLRKLSGVLRARFAGRSRWERRQYAQTVLAQWALLPEKEACEQLRRLLRREGALCESDDPLLFLPYSPTSDAFNADAVIAAWKKRQTDARFTLAALCPATEQAKQWAEKLERPAVRLVDGKAVERLLVESCPVVPDSFRTTRRRALPADWKRKLLAQVHPVRAGLYALLMLLLYIFGGRLIHLAAFALFCALALLAIHRRAGCDA